MKSAKKYFDQLSGVHTAFRCESWSKYTTLLRTIGIMFPSIFVLDTQYSQKKYMIRKIQLIN